ncbi:flagellar basal-body rod protein FlgB [Gammaproteobacteria bacterium 45_16_T64]|nr:flagellar basal-body rod protein FlgB [Gammaproteobacteria bacterium 45_16_T64]
MAINFDKAFGVHEHALTLRAERANILANNIANADTPGFQARDIDFKEVLKTMSGQPGMNMSMTSTQSGHVNGLLNADSINGLKYRMADQPSIDGNTVDLQKERAEFTKNTLDFNSSFTFLNGRIRGLMTAIRGE